MAAMCSRKEWRLRRRVHEKVSEAVSKGCLKDLVRENRERVDC